jgi:hypothetical protein
LIAEPDVALTDYALALECALFIGLLYRQPRDAAGTRSWFVVFFFAIAVAAVLGGTEHGFIREKGTALHVAVWKGTLLAIGVSALAAWMVGARLIARAATRWVGAIASVLFVAYLVALTRTDSFLVAIVHYLPAVVFLLLVFGWRYARGSERHYLWGMGGLLLTFAAAAVQRAGIGLHPVWFNHNALYHLIQVVALLLLFWAAREIVRGRGTQRC